MNKKPSSRITQLLHAATDGDRKAASELLPLVYVELRRLAASRMAKLPPGNTLQPTALVHEAYMRLVGKSDPGWNNRGHFFGAAAHSMRQILVDQARRKSSRKHGGDQQRVDADAVDIPIDIPTEDILALDEAIERLRKDDSRKAEIVMLRYFAGLSNQETATALDISLRTVEREWQYIMARLRKEITDIKKA